MHLYGVERSDEEVRQFVLGYRAALLEDRTQRYHALMAFAPPGGARVLDYGCGWGVNSVGMWEKGNDVLGIDYSENEVEICRLAWGERERLEFRTASISDLPDASFDCVLSSQVAEHVHNLGVYLTGIGRVLEPEGLLVISVPGGITPKTIRPLLRRDLQARLRDFSASVLRDYDKTHHHIHSWDQFHFVRLLGSVGFRMERYEPAEGVPLPTKRIFGGRLRLSRSRFRHLCYTMVFSFRKVADVRLPIEA